MTEPLPRPTMSARLEEIVGFYDRLLTIPEVRQSPRIEYIRNMREVMAGLADRELLEPDEVLLILHAQRHALTGISAEELGLPPRSRVRKGRKAHV